MTTFLPMYAGDENLVEKSRDDFERCQIEPVHCHWWESVTLSDKETTNILMQDLTASTRVAFLLQ